MKYNLSTVASVFYFLLSSNPLVLSQPSTKFQIIESTNLSKILKPATKQNMLIILYVSSPLCPYCKKLETDILIPMLKSDDYKNKLLLRKLVLNSKEQIINFNGNLQSPQSLMSEYGVKTTPTLIFLDKYGTQLNQAIVGHSSDEFYWYYLDTAIKKSNQQVKNLSINSNN